MEIAPIRQDIPPNTAGTWPYDRVFRRAEDAAEDTPAEFLERFSPAEAAENIKAFFDTIQPQRSLVFFYLNYDNPLNSERRKYVLVGAAEVDEVSPQHRWEQIDDEKARVYGDLVWNRFISHGYSEGRAHGSLMIAILKRHWIRPTSSWRFRTSCRNTSNTYVARSPMTKLQYSSENLPPPLNAENPPTPSHTTGINRSLGSIGRWTPFCEKRGAFPGIGPVLEALGFPKAILYVDQHIVAKGIQNVRQFVLDRIADPKLAENSAAVRGYELVAKTIKVLPDTTRDLLLDRLCLFEMNTEQVKLIAGGGLVSEEDRRSVGLVSDAAAIRDNPYIIVEEYSPVDREDRIAFHRIDQGIYFAKSRGGETIPGLDAFHR